MHYEIERRTHTDGWLRSRRTYRLLTDAQVEAEAIRKRGEVVRIVQVNPDGSRRVVG